VAGVFAVGYVYAPRTMRLMAGMWTSHAVVDGVQPYRAAEQRS
jgi:hypothetical protein